MEMVKTKLIVAALNQTSVVSEAKPKHIILVKLIQQLQTSSVWARYSYHAV